MVLLFHRYGHVEPPAPVPGPLVTDATLPAYEAVGEIKLEPSVEVRCRRGGEEERRREMYIYKA